MKQNIILLFLILFALDIHAQCPTSNYFLNSQTKIDDFSTNFPNCTNPPHSLFIQGSGVTNLNGLSQIVTVGDDLLISNCDNLINLSGLSSLVSVSDNLHVKNSENLTNLDGIENLGTVGGDIFIAGLPNLSNLNGLSGLTTVGGYLDIQNCIIIDLAGLENLSSLGGSLALNDLSELTNTDALGGLNSIGKNIYIWHNPKLTNLDGLINIFSMNGFISIFDNILLSDISGIENIDHTTINTSGTDLTILDNLSLSLCEVQSVCEFITLAALNPNLTTNIQNNASGCNSETEIDAACDTCTPPTVTFTAPSDFCIDAGIQANLGSGTPTGGVYSGPGVTDDANGITYSFNLAAAGVGVHTLTYDYTDENGCMNSASNNVEIFDLPTITYTAPADICVDRDVQTGLGGATSVGGVYSGSGVTDDGNGMTYSFDPAAAEVGVHTLTYNYTDGNGCMNSSSDDVEVFDLPTVIFTAPADLCIDAGVQTGLGGATPALGVYTGSGVTDDGNVTYSFDPGAAGVGIHTLTYYYTDGNGCMNSSSDDVEVFDVPSLTASNGSTTCGLDNGQVILELDVFQPITLHDANGPITYDWGADNVNGFDFYAALFIPAGTYNLACNK